jgi:hypothetical protein
MHLHYSENQWSSMRETVAAIAGFVVASIIPAAVLGTIGLIGGERDFHSIILTSIALYPFSAAAVLVFGVPAFFLLRPFRPGHWWSVTAVGLLLGGLVMVVLRLPNRPDFHDFLWTGPLAAVSTLAFWSIWSRGVGAKKRS